jgi:hypothetical protein
MNPFTKILGGYVAIPSNPEHMLLHSMLGVLESYWTEDDSIVTPTANAYKDAVGYLTSRFGQRHPVVSYAKTLWSHKL